MTANASWMSSREPLSKLAQPAQCRINGNTAGENRIMGQTRFHSARCALCSAKGATGALKKFELFCSPFLVFTVTQLHTYFSDTSSSFSSANPHVARDLINNFSAFLSAQSSHKSWFNYQHRWVERKANLIFIVDFTWRPLLGYH